MIKNILTVFLFIIFAAMSNFASDAMLDPDVKQLNTFDQNWGLNNQWEKSSTHTVSKLYPTKKEARDAFESFQIKVRRIGIPFLINHCEATVQSTKVAGCWRVILRQERKNEIISGIKIFNDLIAYKKENKLNNPNLAIILEDTEKSLNKFTRIMNKHKYSELKNSLFKEVPQIAKRVSFGETQLRGANIFSIGETELPGANILSTKTPEPCIGAPYFLIFPNFENESFLLLSKYSDYESPDCPVSGQDILSLQQIETINEILARRPIVTKQKAGELVELYLNKFINLSDHKKYSKIGNLLLIQVPKLAQIGIDRDREHTEEDPGIFEIKISYIEKESHFLLKAKFKKPVKDIEFNLTPKQIKTLKCILHSHFDTRFN